MLVPIYMITEKRNRTHNSYRGDDELTNVLKSAYRWPPFEIKTAFLDIDIKNYHQTSEIFVKKMKFSMGEKAICSKQILAEEVTVIHFNTKTMMWLVKDDLKMDVFCDESELKKITNTVPKSSYSFVNGKIINRFVNLKEPLKHIHVNLELSDLNEGVIDDEIKSIIKKKLEKPKEEKTEHERMCEFFFKRHNN